MIPWNVELLMIRPYPNSSLLQKIMGVKIGLPRDIHTPFVLIQHKEIDVCVFLEVDGFFKRFFHVMDNLTCIGFVYDAWTR